MEKLKSKYVIIVCLTVLVLLVPGWLCQNAFDGFSFNNDFHSTDPDGMYYYRVAEQARLSGSTECLSYDSYGNFPYKAKIGFPPLYIRLMYYAQKLCFAISPENADRILGLWPVLSSLIVVVWVMWALWYMGYPSVFLLFATLALLPLHPGFLMGKYAIWDHDHIVTLFFWVWLISAMLYWEKGNTSRKAERIWTWVGGIGAGLFLASWIGALLVFLIMTLVCFAMWFFNDNDAKRYLDYSCKTIGIAVLVNVLYIAFNPTAYGFTLLDFGYLHISALVAAVLFIRLLQSFNSSNKAKGIFIAVVVAAFALFAIFNAEGFSDLLKRVSAQDPVYQNIRELQPIIVFAKLFDNPSSLMKIFTSFGWCVFLLPIFLFLSLKRILGKNSAFILQLWLNILIISACFQGRYVRLAGIVAGLYSAFVFYALWKAANAYWGSNRSGRIKICCSFVLMILFYRVGAIWALTGLTPVLEKADYETYLWIKENTPVTSGYDDTGTPEYGFLNYWDRGHHLNAYAHRPTTTNNCQWGMKAMADVFSSTTEKEAYDLCEKYKVRYILITPDRRRIESDIDFWHEYKNQEDGPRYKALPSTVNRTKDYKTWFFSWLNNTYGLCPKYLFNASSNFRIIFANKAEGCPPNLFSNMIFERVPGAKLIFEAEPDTVVSVSIDLVVQKVLCTYRAEQTASADGIVEFTLPYSCFFNNNVVSTGELYTVEYIPRGKAMPNKAKVKVTEPLVISGSIVPSSNIHTFK